MPEEKETPKKKSFKDALAAYGETIKVFRKGDFKKALDAIKEFLQEYPDEMELTERANVYLNICEGRLNKEKITLKTFSDYYQYGVYKMNQGEFKEALKALEKAREKKPKEGKVHYLLANVFCLLENEKKCLEYLKKAVKMDKFFGLLAQNETNFEPFQGNKKFNLIVKTK